MKKCCFSFFYPCIMGKVAFSDSVTNYYETGFERKGVYLSKGLKADIMMIIVTLGWGSSYLFTKSGTAFLAPFNFVALRFLFAFAIAALLLCRYIRWQDKRTLYHSAILGALLFAMYSLVNWGVSQTTISNSSFLVSLTVIFVPCLSAFLLKKWPGKNVFCGAILAIIGIACMTLNENFALNKGDIICIGAALAYACHILYTSRVVKQCHSISLGVLQLGFCGLFALLATFLFEQPVWPQTPRLWWDVLFLSTFCTAICFILQVFAQKYTTPSHISVIYSLEPISAAFFAYLAIGETLRPLGYLGAALIFSGVIVTEITDILPHKKTKNPSDKQASQATA